MMIWIVFFIFENEPCSVSFYSEADCDQEYGCFWTVERELKSQPTREYLVQQLENECPLLAFQTPGEPPFFLFELEEGLFLIKGGSLLKIDSENLTDRLRQLLKQFAENGNGDYIDSAANHPTPQFLSIWDGTWKKIVYLGDPTLPEYGGGIEYLDPSDFGIREVITFSMELDQIISLKIQFPDKILR